MSETVIHAEGIGKRYRVGERERYLALRDVLTRAFTAPFRRNGRRRPVHYLWALRDVSFDIEQGEVVGLIGRNGSGKTTLLKILSRITRPTEGFAEVHGRVGSLLEVGTGFHPELTGRENVYLSGAVLGMRKSEINRKFDEIVAFSGVERFLDTPLKHFSTGMQMRLAFSVAAHLEPEILLVDEVLAVGDLEFQKKCLGKMDDVTKAGRTIVFVSHQMNQIRRLCRRCVWLEGGQIRKEGSTVQVLGDYEAALTGTTNTEDREGSATNQAARFLGWRFLQPHGETENILRTLGVVRIKFMLKVTRPIRRGVHGIALYDDQNRIMWGTSVNSLSLDVGTRELIHSLPSLPLRPGVYHLLVSLWEDGELIDMWHCHPPLVVGTEPVTHPNDEWQGVLNLPSELLVE